MKTEFLKIFTILLLSLSLYSANQNCSNNSCTPIETIQTLEMETELDGTMIHLSWKFNSSEPIYGFSSTILSPDNSTLYQSPVLHSDERKMTINYELTSSDNSICLQVMKNQTKVLTQKCEHVEASSLKMVIGILAGTIFIIPCIIALGFIIYKDHYVRKLERIADLIEEEQTDKLLCSQSIEESQDGSVSCDNIAELQISHDDHVTHHHVTPEKSNSNDAISDENIEANKDGGHATRVKIGVSGEDNLGFISEIPDAEKANVMSQDKEGSEDYTCIGKSRKEQTTVIIEDRNPDTEKTNKRLDTGKSKEVQPCVTKEDKNSENEKHNKIVDPGKSKEKQTYVTIEDRTLDTEEVNEIADSSKSKHDVQTASKEDRNSENEKPNKTVDTGKSKIVKTNVDIDDRNEVVETNKREDKRETQDEVQTNVRLEDKVCNNEETNKRPDMCASKEVETKVTIESWSSETEEANKRLDEIKQNEPVTLKIDIDLARQMAKADNEIVEYSAHL